VIFARTTPDVRHRKAVTGASAFGTRSAVCP
jgi:hypothetical protein